MPIRPFRSRLARHFCFCRLRFCALTGLLLCCLLLFSLPASSSTTLAQRHNAGARLKQNTLGVEHAHAHGNEQDVVHDRPRSSSEPRPSKITSDSDDAQLLEDVRRLTTLMPRELELEAFLAPFDEAGGEHHLRNLALRVRAFKEALEAWEAVHLHLDTDEGSPHYAQDVVQRLRAANLSDQQLRAAIATYDAFRAYVNQFAAHLFPWTMAHSPDHMSLHASFYHGGRGLVFTAGDAQLPYLLTSIPSFRKMGCTLPVEIMYLGDTDLSPDSRDLLEALPGVFTRDLSLMINDDDWGLRGWALKPFATLMSSFREVLFVDADALFFVNPEILFEDKQYVQTGALFFKDRNLMPEKKRTWLIEVLPKPISQQVKRNRLWTGESGHMQDSGVVVVDKWEHFIPMLLTTRLNGPDRDGDRETGKRGVYDMVYGDKETFWLSWELAADTDYAFYDGEAGTMGALRDPSLPSPISARAAKAALLRQQNETEIDATSATPPEKSSAPPPSPSDTPIICSSQLVHFDREGRPLWWNGWLGMRKVGAEDAIEFSPFEVYAREPKERRRRGTKNPYTVQADNVVCLETEYFEPFSPKELELLNMLRLEAQKNLIDW